MLVSIFKEIKFKTYLQVYIEWNPAQQSLCAPATLELEPLPTGYNRDLRREYRNIVNEENESCST